MDSINYVIHDYWEEVSDPRTKDLFPMSGGLWKMLAVMSLFLMFVTRIGPQLTKDKKPYDLRSAMVVYNLVVVLINGYFFCNAVYYLNYGKELLDFKFPDRNDPKFYTKVQLKKAWLVYMYAWTKVYDMLDTIYLVLRKKKITGESPNFVNRGKVCNLSEIIYSKENIYLRKKKFKLDNFS